MNFITLFKQFKYVVNYVWLIDIKFEYNEILTILFLFFYNTIIHLFIIYGFLGKKNNYMVNNTVHMHFFTIKSISFNQKS
jgi:hypothetical protein